MAHIIIKIPTTRPIAGTSSTPPTSLRRKIEWFLPKGVHNKTSTGRVATNMVLPLVGWGACSAFLLVVRCVIPLDVPHWLQHDGDSAIDRMANFVDYLMWKHPIHGQNVWTDLSAYSTVTRTLHVFEMKIGILLGCPAVIIGTNHSLLHCEWNHGFYPR